MCIISILRLYYLYQASVSTDLTYDNVAPATWSAVEFNVAIMCACVPAMRPIISVMFPRLLSSTSGHTASNPFSGRGTHQSNAYYHRNESAVELSHAPSGRSDSERLSFDTATNHPDAIHVKQDWTVTEMDMNLRHSIHAR